MLPRMYRLASGFDPLAATPRRCIKHGLSSVTDLITLDDAIFVAKGHRLSILNHLAAWGPTNVNELAVALAIHANSVSKELEPLERLGLVTWTRHNGHRYRLTPGVLQGPPADGAVQFTLRTKTGDWLLANRKLVAASPCASASPNELSGCDSDASISFVPNLGLAFDCVRGHRLEILSTLAGATTDLREITDEPATIEADPNHRGRRKRSSKSLDARHGTVLTGAFVTDIASTLSLSVPTTSSELRELDTAGLVSWVPHKHFRFYSLTQRIVAVLASGLKQFTIFARNGDWLLLSRDERPPNTSSSSCENRLLPPDSWVARDLTPNNQLIGRWVADKSQMWLFSIFAALM